LNIDSDNKRLVPPHLRTPQFPKCESGKSMSIITGTISNGLIALAADSLLTDPNTGSKSYVDKISVVDFSDDEVLVAQAGLSSITNRIIEIMREKSGSLKINHVKVVIDVAEESVREVKDRLDNEQKDYVARNGASLVLAFYCSKKPYLYTLDFSGSGVVNAAEKNFVSAGIGSPLANYLLSEFSSPHNVSWLVTSIFVVKKVKDNNAFCGGNTTIKLIYPDRGAQNLSQNFINFMEKNITSIDEKTKSVRNKQTLSALMSATKKVREIFIAPVKKHLKNSVKKANLTLDNPNHLG